MATTVEFYEVYHADMNGGMSKPSVAARFSTQLMAQKYVGNDKYMYVAGGPTTIKVYDTLEEIAEAKKAAAYESGLKKLTPEEREALGVPVHG